MSLLIEATRIEWLKVRRSRILGITALGFSLAALMSALFMKILSDPTWAAHFGTLTAKAQATLSTADWSSYLSLLTQAIAIGGFIIFGFIVTWLFGREWSDRTLKDLLAVPTPREIIVGAKFLTATGWILGLVVWVTFLGVVLGMLIGLPGGTMDVLAPAFGRLAVVVVLTILLTSPSALIASAGRGYLAPVGVLLLCLFLAQIAAALDLGAYFPWSIPGLLSGAAGPSAQALGPLSYIVVILVGIGGVVGTIAWWRLSDQS